MGTAHSRGGVAPDRILHLSNARSHHRAGFLRHITTSMVFFFYCIVFLVFYIIYLRGSIFCTVNFQ